MTSSETEFGRVVSVLVFYVFSCTCLHRRSDRKNSRSAARVDSEMLWRSEIESGPIPSFLRQSPGSCSTRNCSSSNTTTSPPRTPQSFEDLYADLDGAGRRDAPRRITTVSVKELPKINPPLNDQHPPVVSALGTRKDTAWMRMPPPTAREMRDINRRVHLRKESLGLLGQEGGNLSLEMFEDRPGSGPGGISLETRLAELESKRVELENRCIAEKSRKQARERTGSRKVSFEIPDLPPANALRTLDPIASSNPLPPSRGLQEKRQPSITPPRTITPPPTSVRDSKLVVLTRINTPVDLPGEFLLYTPPASATLESIQKPPPVAKKPLSPMSLEDFKREGWLIG